MSRPLPSPASQSAANSLTNLASLSAIENDIVADLMGSVDDTLRGGGEDQPVAKRAKTRGGDVMDLPPPLPEEATAATPARVAGASVLASLGESVPALPEIGADHDYLLQNLVHVRVCVCLFVWSIEIRMKSLLILLTYMSSSTPIQHGQIINRQLR
jgi:hypothetical protein